MTLRKAGGRIAPVLQSGLALLVAIACLTARAEQPLSVVLNWTPNAQHAPLFYARAQGWYRQAGIELSIEPLLGSPAAIERVASGGNILAVSDFVAWLRAAAKGAPGTAVMVLDDASPYAFYFDRARGPGQAAEFHDRRLAAQPQDPMRALWPVLAARLGVDATVQWVDLANPAKPDALARGEVDVALNAFLHNHLGYAAALGEQLGVLWWRELGFDAYGLVLVSSAPLMRDAPDLLRRFVAVTQAAWTQCRAAPAPCVDALIVAQPDLDRAHELALWQLAQALPAGAFDDIRVQRTWADVEAAFGVRAPVGRSVVNREFLPAAGREVKN